MTRAERQDEAGQRRPEQRRGGGGGASTAKGMAIGLLVGFLLGAALVWAVGGNPLSDVNEVEYRDIVVASVSEEGDQLCWSLDPEQRDAPQQCAILTIDPALSEPEQGEEVTIGLVRLRAPDGAEFQQVVYVAPVDAEEPVEGTQPDQPAS